MERAPPPSSGLLGGGGVDLGKGDISESLGCASAVAMTQSDGKFYFSHPASAGDGIHTHTHHLLGFSAALAPKFTHCMQQWRWDRDGHLRPRCWVYRRGQGLPRAHTGLVLPGQSKATTSGRRFRARSCCPRRSRGSAGLPQAPQGASLACVPSPGRSRAPQRSPGLSRVPQGSPGSLPRLCTPP